MDRLHRRVPSHRPAPEDRRALRRGPAVGDLLDLTLATQAAHRKDRRRMHREEQHRAVQEDNREGVERVVIEIPVPDGEGRGPVEMGEQSERHHLAPAPHQQRLEEEGEVEEDRRAEGPGEMRPHPERTRPGVGPDPPRDDREGQEESGDQVPPPLLERREDLETVLRRGRLEREPGELSDELDGAPPHRLHHVQPDDLEGEEPEQ